MTSSGLICYDTILQQMDYCKVVMYCAIFCSLCSPSPFRRVRLPQGGCHINGIDDISPHLCSSLIISGYISLFYASCYIFPFFFYYLCTLPVYDPVFLYRMFVRAESHISLCDCLFLSLVYTITSLNFSASDQCSLTYTFSFLFASPIYFLLQPLQSKVYTPSLGSVEGF